MKIPRVKPMIGPEHRTNPIIWLFAIICAVLAVAVIITGLIVFIGYLAIRPKVPLITVSSAHLNDISYSQDGVLAVRIAIVMNATNQNLKAHASFYDARFILSFHGLEMAELVADPFDVRKNSSTEFHYLVESNQIPLSSPLMELAESSLRGDRVTFELNGNARTRWRVGFVGSVKFWLHLNCRLNFFPSNGSVVDSHCSSKSH